MSDRKLQHLIESYVQAYNQFDIAAMLRDFSDNCTFSSISGGIQTIFCQNKMELHKFAEQSAAYFKERTQTITNWILGDDKAAIEIQYKAILNRDLPNGYKAGQELNLQGVSVFAFRDGKIISLIDYS